MQAHNSRVTVEFYQNEANHRAATGNPPPGQGVEAAPKKPKLEDKDSLKARLAEFKAKKAAQAGGIASGSGSPSTSTVRRFTYMCAISCLLTNATATT